MSGRLDDTDLQPGPHLHRSKCLTSPRLEPRQAEKEITRLPKRAIGTFSVISIPLPPCTSLISWSTPFCHLHTIPTLHPSLPQHDRTISTMAEPTQISAAALAEHNKASDVWMAISGKVYDCTDFVDEHPGGDEIMLAEAGKDATEPFDDVGHSEDARAMLEPMYVGEFEGGEAVRLFSLVLLLLDHISACSVCCVLTRLTGD